MTLSLSRWKLPLMSFLLATLVAAMGATAAVVQADEVVPPAERAALDGSAMVPPEATDFDAVINAEEMEDLVALTERIEQHVTVDSDGLVRLDPGLTAEELGVSEAFMADLRTAYDVSNELIASGEMVVAEDFTVSPGAKFQSIDGGDIVDPIAPSPDGSAVADAAFDAAAFDLNGDASVPDWNAYGYQSGAMFYNSYNTYYRYYSSYWNLCNVMSAHLRMPHISRNLQYFYAYNSQYLRSRCYRNVGVWYYLPYRQGCRYSSGSSYQPCYGSLQYRPAYYWTRAYTYNQTCRCYGYNWIWQGYYSRY